MSDVTEKRLETKCFRGAQLRLAGNFSRWSNYAEFWADPIVLQHFLPHAESNWCTATKRNSLCLDYGSVVGWSSTAPARHFNPRDLERFEPNRKSTALRVRCDRHHLRAPQTRLVTVLYACREGSSGPIMQIYSIYAGDDIGPLEGDVTHRNRAVFFDWNHPGR